MSGVRNLRAMFEQKGSEPENSPPDNRGRSPGPGLASFGSPTPSQSPRPLSKVRTNFVAIEKDGRIGLRREPSGDSVSVSSRRLSNETENTTPAPEKNEMFTDVMAQSSASFKTNLANEPIPESPRQESPAKFSPSKGSLTPNVTPNPNPDKVVDVEEAKTKLTPADPTSSIAVNGNGVRPAATHGLNSSRQANDKAKLSGTSTNNTKSVPKVAPISTTTKTTVKPTKSPAITKAPKSPATSLITQKKHTTAVHKEETPKKTTIPKSSVSSGKKPGPLNLPPANTGFVKPKPKSPTRPVKLPERLTTHTAASASKLGGAGAPAPRQTLSRASGNVQNLGVPHAASRRPTSRASASATSTTSAPKNLRRQSSTINRPRPSIGPPPKPTSRDHPIIRRESPVDDGILARLMRPTTSSTSKTTDKAPITPPRKQTVSTLAKKPVSKDGEGSGRKSVAKPAESAKPKDSHVVTKPVAVEKTAKTTAKQAAAAAKPTAKQIAPAVAQTETAEEAVQAAAVTNDTATTPIVEEAETDAVEGGAPAPALPTTAASEEPVVVEEPEVVKEPEVANEPESVPEPKGPVEETSESIKVVNSTNDNVPVVSDDPEEVEDIEAVVQEAVETPIQESLVDMTDKVEDKEEEPPKAAEASVKEATEASVTEATEISEEKPKADEASETEAA